MKSRLTLHADLAAMLQDVGSTDDEGYWTVGLLDNALNEAVQRVTMYLQRVAPRYLVKETTIAVTGGVYNYTLPSDMAQLIRIYRLGTPTRTYEPYRDWESVLQHGSGFAVAERYLNGARVFGLRCWPQGVAFPGASTIVVEYNYRPERLTPTMDGRIAYTMTDPQIGGTDAITAGDGMVGLLSLIPAPSLNQGIVTEVYGAVSPLTEVGETGLLRFRRVDEATTAAFGEDPYVTKYVEPIDDWLLTVDQAYDVGDVPPDLPDETESLILQEAFCYALSINGELRDTHMLMRKEMYANLNMYLQRITHEPENLTNRAPYNMVDW